MAGPTKAVRTRREALVREHMESENVHDYDATIDTFHHPRYEIIPSGDVFDGEAQVREYFRETRTAFPDQRNELIALHHADDGVIVEFDLLGTHLGSFRGLPATGRSFRCRMTAFFLFEDRGEGDGLVCERVYFDRGTILQQLGIAHDPTSLAGRLSTVLTHPVTIASAFYKHRRRRD